MCKRENRGNGGWRIFFHLKLASCLEMITAWEATICVPVKLGLGQFLPKDNRGIDRFVSLGQFLPKVKRGIDRFVWLGQFLPEHKRGIDRFVSLKKRGGLAMCLSFYWVRGGQDFKNIVWDTQRRCQLSEESIEDASSTLHGIVKLWRSYVSLCTRGRNNIFLWPTSRFAIWSWDMKETLGLGFEIWSWRERLVKELNFRIRLCNLKLQTAFKVLWRSFIKVYHLGEGFSILLD